MSELSDLYQEVILDHNRRPRNYGELPGANRRALGHNPLCGDRLVVFVRVAGDCIEDLRFEGSGCAISKASASLMTEAVKGRRLDEAAEIIGRFHQMVTSPVEDAIGDDLGKLAALGGVREFPVRVKCASLAWHTLRAALAAGPTDVVTTE